MTLNFNLNDDVLTVSVDGRLDTEASVRFDAEIAEISRNNPHESMVLDAEKLQYVASSGLRTILKLVKTENLNEGMELNNQLIGITSAHNARQLGGYHIGRKKIKEDLLIRTASISGLSEADSALLADKYKAYHFYSLLCPSLHEMFPWCLYFCVAIFLAA